MNARRIQHGGRTGRALATLAATVLLAWLGRAPLLGQTQAGLDWGDAPLPYPTTGANAAVHAILPGMFLGKLVDSEVDGQPDASAAGDDGSPKGALDDEDGIAFPLPWVPGKTTQINVTISKDGYLHGWADFDQDGSWLGVYERIVPGLKVTAGTNAILFNCPPDAKLGSTYVRFRYTTSKDAQPGGFLPDGEVEDYRVVLTTGEATVDFGDAPGKYPTLLANDGARHVILKGFSLGSGLDGEGDGQPTPESLGDDKNPAGSDDEDGVAFLSPLVAGQTAKVRITCMVPTGSTAFVDAWLDFNRNEGWSDAGEQVLVSVPVTSGDNDLTIGIPSAALAGVTYARFRLSLKGGLSASGLALDGEVEDYQVAIEPPAALLDFGDAPGKYPTLLGNDGARHGIIEGFALGLRVDGEADGQPTLDALGDDNNPSTGDDEDGVLFLTPLVPGQSAKVRVTCSIPGGTTTASARLDAWVDFNGNETWLDAGEQILVSVPVTAGINDLTFQVPAGAQARGTYARFRLSMKGGLGPRGVAQDGEVEDHAVKIEAPTVALDFGDAPGKYPTLLANNGARHRVVDGFSLGASIDAEADGQPDPSAFGDDGNPATIDDEDGVVFTSGLLAGQVATVRVTVRVPGLTTNSKPLLDAWVDFNQNESWGDPGEQVFVSLPVVAGTNSLSFNVPMTALPGVTFARFRLSFQAQLGPGGIAEAGEVEDYQVGIEGPSRLLDYGDAPTGYPTTLAADGARHGFKQGLLMGQLLDVEPDGQPGAASLGDDSNPASSDDEDGVTFLTPLVAGRTAVVRVVTPARLVYLNAWIDFGQDQGWSQAGDQIITAYPLVPGNNDITFQVPSNARVGGTFSRFRLSSTQVLSFKGLAPDGEVEDHSVRVLSEEDRCDLSCEGIDFWLTFPGNYAPDPSNPPKVSLSIQGTPGTSVEVTQPGTGYLSNHIMPAAGTLNVVLPQSAELGDLNDLVKPLGVRVRASSDVVVAGLNHAAYTSDSFRALNTGLLGRRYVVMASPNFHAGVEPLNGSQFAIVGTVSNTVVQITPKVSSGSRTAGVPYSITLNPGDVYQLRATNDGPSDISGTLIVSSQRVAVFGGHRCANIPNGNVWFCDYVVEQLPPVNTWGDDFLLAPFAGRTGGDWVRVLAASPGTVVTVNGAVVATLGAGDLHSFIMTVGTRIQTSRPALVAQFAQSADADPVPTTQGDPFMMLVQARRHYQNSYRLTVPSADFASNYIHLVVPALGIPTMTLNGGAIPAAMFTPIAGTGHSFARIPVGAGVQAVSGTWAFASGIYGWAEYDSYGHPGCFYAGDVQAPQSSGSLPSLSVNLPNPAPVGDTTANTSFARIPAYLDLVGFSDNCDPKLRPAVQDPAPGTIVVAGSYPVTVTATDASGNETILSTVFVVNRLPRFLGATNNVINELVPYTQALVPMDPDLLSQPQSSNAPLVVSLLAGPQGLIVTNGVLAWTPSEAQGPSTNTVRVTVSDSYGAVTNEFTLTVNEVNQPPSFGGTTNNAINELVAYTQPLAPRDNDLPAQSLTTSLVSGPAGLAVTNGVLAWTPSEAQGPSTNTVQVRVTDGMATVTNTLTLTVREVNVAPTLAGATNNTIYPAAGHTQALAPQDADVPAQTLTVTLQQGPAGLVVTNGVLAWTPTAAQALTTNSVRVAVSDGVASTTNNFTLIVRGPNTPPRFDGATNNAINELVGYTQPLAPRDNDVPLQVLTAALVSGPAGLVVTNGVLAWTPSEAQGPSTNLVQVSVSDGMATVTNTLTLTVREVNVAPTLAGATNNTIYPAAGHVQVLAPQDSDVPMQTLTVTLQQGPAGLVVTNGVLAWTPTAAQALTTNSVRVAVSDGVASTTNNFTLIVRGPNTPPRFDGATNNAINELVGYTQPLAPRDNDVPVQALAASLVSGPTGLVVTNGVLAWTPTEAQGPSTNTVLVQVSDGIATVTNTLTLTVREVNVAPTLAGATNNTIYPAAGHTQALAPQDADVPAQTLTVTLQQGPAGLVVTNGVLAWTPTAAQALTTNSVRVAVSDGVASTTNNFTLIVRGPNTPPRFDGATNNAINELVGYTQPLAPRDNDVPLQVLTAALVSGPAGLVVTNGVLAWTPSEAQGPSTNAVLVRVSDGIATVTNTLTLTVREVNVAPTLAGATNNTIFPAAGHTQALAPQDADVPAQTLTVTLQQGPAGLVVTNGVLAWTPTAAQALTTNSVRVAVSDGVASTTNNFTLIVRGPNTPPRFDGATNNAINELVGYTQPLAPRDNDVPLQALAASLVSGPTGLVVTNGVLAWTPTEAQGPSTNTVLVQVSDGIATVTNTLTLTVREVNLLPSFTAATNGTVAAGTVFSRNLGPTDPDLPAQTLTVTLLQGPSGMALAGSTLTWAPNSTQVPSTNSVSVSVTDGVATVTNLLVVTVTTTSGGGSTISVANEAQSASKASLHADRPGGLLGGSSWVEDGTLRLRWSDPAGVLEEAPTPLGPWVPVVTEGREHVVLTDGPQRYYRIR